MGARLIFDTTFLIDFQRERRQATGVTPAHDLLAQRGEAGAAISAVTLAEFATGFAEQTHPLVEWVRTAHEILVVDQAVASTYAALARSLRKSGRMIGSNDLWIAATAVCHELPLVTADLADFGRVPRLTLVGYRG